jgi:glycosyltransferase involved in cell wall biosynthesis
VSDTLTLRVALDLDGSLESLDNTMDDLADALCETGELTLVRFRTVNAPRSKSEAKVSFRRVWSPLWRRSLGPAIEKRLPAVDVVHVAGLVTPPTASVPLIISVDDLRPLRGESRTSQRIQQLRRAVARGAILVASSRTASHEVQSVLSLHRNQIVVVPPAVPYVQPTVDGADLVVNVTGLDKPFLELAPALFSFTNSVGAQLVAVTSSAVGQRIRSSGLSIKVVGRRNARAALARARVVLHMSDGARFPSFAIAALSAGIPTLARATAINRELLAGAATLVSNDEEVLAALGDVWSSDARRAIMIAAGHARAVDYEPATAARAYVNLYRDVVRGWNT